MRQLHRQDLVSPVKCNYVTISDLITLLTWDAAIRAGDIAASLLNL